MRIKICNVLKLETKVKRRFAKVSIVSYSRLSLMIIVSASQFQVFLLCGQRLFSIGLVGAFSVIVKTDCETDVALFSNQPVRHCVGAMLLLMT